MGGRHPAVTGATMGGMGFRLMSRETDLGFNYCAGRARGAWPYPDHARGSYHGHGPAGGLGGGRMPMSRYMRSLKSGGSGYCRRPTADSRRRNSVATRARRCGWWRGARRPAEGGLAMLTTYRPVEASPMPAKTATTQRKKVRAAPMTTR